MINRKSINKILSQSRWLCYDDPQARMLCQLLKITGQTKIGVVALILDYTKFEAETREEIDAKLNATGWVEHEKKKLNRYEKQGGAVREIILKNYE